MKPLPKAWGEWMAAHQPPLQTAGERRHFADADCARFLLDSSRFSFALVDCPRAFIPFSRAAAYTYSRLYG